MARRREGKNFFDDDIHNKWFLMGGRHRRSGKVNALQIALQGYTYKYIICDEVIINKSKMKTLTPQQEALLDADTKTLLQAGFLNDDLTPSDKGLDASEAIQFDVNKATLLVKAAAIIETTKTAK